MFFGAVQIRSSHSLEMYTCVFACPFVWFSYVPDMLCFRVLSRASVIVTSTFLCVMLGGGVGYLFQIFVWLLFCSVSFGDIRSNW